MGTLRQRRSALGVAIGLGWVLSACGNDAGHGGVKGSPGTGGATDTGGSPPSSGAVAGSGGSSGSGGSGVAIDAGPFRGTDYYFPNGVEQTAPAGSRASMVGGSDPGAPIEGPSFGEGIGGASSAAGGSFSEGGAPAGGAEAPGSGDMTAPPVEVGGSSSTGSDAGVIPPGQLTAGEWNDLDHWDFWTNLMQGQDAGGDWAAQQTAWGFNTLGRFSLVAKNGSAPAVDVPVVLTGNGAPIWSGRTDVYGRAELFSGMFDAASGPYRIALDPSGQNVVASVAGPTGATPTSLAAGGATSPALSLDLAFLIDTTGSMGDELAYIQAELLDVMSRVRADSEGTIDLRLSVNFYRDLQDEYVVRSYPFTADVETAVDALKAQSADGGGDFPEAMDYGLKVAVEQLDWRPSAMARVMFLVCDAPPHSTSDVLGRVHDAVREAADRGIRILPVSGSGIDKPTEFFLRFVEIATAGSYTFLTDDSGIGLPHLDPHPTIGPYQVELLNNLLVSLVKNRLGQG